MAEPDIYALESLTKPEAEPDIYAPEDIQFAGPGEDNPSIIEDLGRGINQGVSSVKAGLVGYRAMYNHMMGDTEERDQLLQSVKEINENAQAFGPSVGKIEDIQNPGDFAQWLSGGIGTIIPFGAASLTGVGGVGTVGARIGGRKLVQELTKQIVDKNRKEGIETLTKVGIGRKSATEQIDKALLKKRQGIGKRVEEGIKQERLDPAFKETYSQATQGARKIGEAMGIYGTTAGLETGLMYGESAGSEGNYDPWIAIKYGSINGLLDSVGGLYMINRVFRGKGIIDKPVDEAKKGVRYLAGLAKSNGVEISTETMQEVMNVASQREYEGKDVFAPFNEDEMSALYNAAALAAGYTTVTTGLSDAAHMGLKTAKDKAARVVPTGQKSLAAQLASLHQGNDTSGRRGVLITPDENTSFSEIMKRDELVGEKKLAEGLTTYQVTAAEAKKAGDPGLEGTIIYRDGDEATKKLIEEGRFNEAIDQPATGRPKAVEGQKAQVQTTKDSSGNSILDTDVDENNRAEVAAIHARVAAQDEHETGQRDQEEVIAERQEAAQEEAPVDEPPTGAPPPPTDEATGYDEFGYDENGFNQQGLDEFGADAETVESHREAGRLAARNLSNDEANKQFLELEERGAPNLAFAFLQGFNEEKDNSKARRSKAAEDSLQETPAPVEVSGAILGEAETAGWNTLGTYASLGGASKGIQGKRFQQAHGNKHVVRVKVGNKVELRTPPGPEFMDVAVEDEANQDIYSLGDEQSETSLLMETYDLQEGDIGSLANKAVNIFENEEVIVGQQSGTALRSRSVGLENREKHFRLKPKKSQIDKLKKELYATKPAEFFDYTPFEDADGKWWIKIKPKKHLVQLIADFLTDQYEAAGYGMQDLPSHMKDTLKEARRRAYAEELYKHGSVSRREADRITEELLDVWNSPLSLQVKQDQKEALFDHRKLIVNMIISDPSNTFDKSIPKELAQRVRERADYLDPAFVGPTLFSEQFRKVLNAYQGNNVFDGAEQVERMRAYRAGVSPDDIYGHFTKFIKTYPSAATKEGQTDKHIKVELEDGEFLYMNVPAITILGMQLQALYSTDPYTTGGYTPKKVESSFAIGLNEVMGGMWKEMGKGKEFALKDRRKFLDDVMGQLTDTTVLYSTKDTEVVHTWGSIRDDIKAGKYYVTSEADKNLHDLLFQDYLPYDVNDMASYRAARKEAQLQRVLIAEDMEIWRGEYLTSKYPERSTADIEAQVLREIQNPRSWLNKIIDQKFKDWRDFTHPMQQSVQEYGTMKVKYLENSNLLRLQGALNTIHKATQQLINEGLVEPTDAAYERTAKSMLAGQLDKLSYDKAEEFLKDLDLSNEEHQAKILSMITALSYRKETAGVTGVPNIIEYINYLSGFDSMPGFDISMLDRWLNDHTVPRGSELLQQVIDNYGDPMTNPVAAQALQDKIVSSSTKLSAEPFVSSSVLKNKMLNAVAQNPTTAEINKAVGWTRNMLRADGNIDLESGNSFLPNLLDTALLGREQKSKWEQHAAVVDLASEMVTYLSSAMNDPYFVIRGFDAEMMENAGADFNDLAEAQEAVRVAYQKWAGFSEADAPLPRLQEELDEARDALADEYAKAIRPMLDTLAKVREAADVAKKAKSGLVQFNLIEQESREAAESIQAESDETVLKMQNSGSPQEAIDKYSARKMAEKTKVLEDAVAAQESIFNILGLPVTEQKITNETDVSYKRLRLAHVAAKLQATHAKEDAAYASEEGKEALREQYRAAQEEADFIKGILSQHKKIATQTRKDIAEAKSQKEIDSIRNEGVKRLTALFEGAGISPIVQKKEQIQNTVTARKLEGVIRLADQVAADHDQYFAVLTFAAHTSSSEIAGLGSHPGKTPGGYSTKQQKMAGKDQTHETYHGVSPTDLHERSPFKAQVGTDPVTEIVAIVNKAKEKVDNFANGLQVDLQSVLDELYIAVHGLGDPDLLKIIYRAEKLIAAKTLMHPPNVQSVRPMKMLLDTIARESVKVGQIREFVARGKNRQMSMALPKVYDQYDQLSTPAQKAVDRRIQKQFNDILRMDNPYLYPDGNHFIRTSGTVSEEADQFTGNYPEKGFNITAETLLNIERDKISKLTDQLPPPKTEPISIAELAHREAMDSKVRRQIGEELFPGTPTEHLGQMSPENFLAWREHLIELGISVTNFVTGGLGRVMQATVSQFKPSVGELAQSLHEQFGIQSPILITDRHSLGTVIKAGKARALEDKIANLVAERARAAANRHSDINADDPNAQANALDIQAEINRLNQELVAAKEQDVQSAVEEKYFLGDVNLQNKLDNPGSSQGMMLTPINPEDPYIIVGLSDAVIDNEHNAMVMVSHEIGHIVWNERKAAMSDKERRGLSRKHQQELTLTNTPQADYPFDEWMADQMVFYMEDYYQKLRESFKEADEQYAKAKGQNEFSNKAAIRDDILERKLKGMPRFFRDMVEVFIKIAKVIADPKKWGIFTTVQKRSPSGLSDEWMSMGNNIMAAVKAREAAITTYNRLLQREEYSAEYTRVMEDAGMSRQEIEDMGTWIDENPFRMETGNNPAEIIEASIEEDKALVASIDLMEKQLWDAETELENLSYAPFDPANDGSVVEEQVARLKSEIAHAQERIIRNEKIRKDMESEGADGTIFPREMAHRVYTHMGGYYDGDGHARTMYPSRWRSDDMVSPEFFDALETASKVTEAAKKGAKNTLLGQGFSFLKEGGETESRGKMNPLVKALHTLWTRHLVTSHKVLRSFPGGDVIANKLQKLGGTAATEQQGNEGIFEIVYHMKAAKYDKKVRAITDAMTREELSALAEDLIAKDGPYTEAGREVRTLLDEFQADYRTDQLDIRRKSASANEVDYPLGQDTSLMRFRKEYFPHMWRTQALASEEGRAKFDELMDKYVKPDWVPALADSESGEIMRNWEEFKEYGFNLLMNRGTIDTTDDINTNPAFANAKQRIFEIPTQELFDAGLISDNPKEVLGVYFRNAFRVLEWERRFGDYEAFYPEDDMPDFMGGIKAADKRKKERKGSREKQGEDDPLMLWNAGKEVFDWLTDIKETQGEYAYNNAKYAVDAIEGKLGKELSPALRAGLDYFTAFMNILLLPMALLASIPDLAGLFVRNGDFKTTLDAIWQNVGRINTKGDIFQMAESFGIITERTMQHALVDLAETGERTAFSETHLKVMAAHEKFFHLIGLNAWTRWTRQIGTQLGQDFLVNNTRDALAGDALAQERLNELGITTEQVQQWVSEGKKTESENDLAIGHALHLFVDEAVMRPGATRRPATASDPIWGVFHHLHQFLYLFKGQIVDRILRMAKQKGFKDPEVKKATLLLMTTMPLAMLGMMIRDFLKYTMVGADAPERDWIDVLNRMGVLGPMNMLVDTLHSRSRGLDAARFGFIGGGANVAMNFALKDFGSAMSGAIPGLNQLSPTREATREFFNGVLNSG